MDEKTAAEDERSFQEIARRMFLSSGDGDYLMARQAYRAGLANQFWWSASQTIEKYLKTVLLMHGKSAKGYGHQLGKLWSCVASLGIPDSPLPRTPGYLTGESWGRGPGGKLTHRREPLPNASFSTFIELADRSGDTNSRYNHFGHEVCLEDLYTLDEFVWMFRGHCRPPGDILPDASSPWRVRQDLLLENLIDGTHQTQPLETKCEMLTWLNPFFTGPIKPVERINAGVSKHPFYILAIDRQRKDKPHAARVASLIDQRIQMDDATRALLRLPTKKRRKDRCPED